MKFGKGVPRAPSGAPRYPPPASERVIPTEDVDPLRDLQDARSGSWLDYLLLGGSPGMVAVSEVATPNTGINSAGSDVMPSASEILAVGLEPLVRLPWAPGGIFNRGADGCSPMSAPVQESMVQVSDCTSSCSDIKRKNHEGHAPFVEGQHLMAPKQTELENAVIAKNERVFYNSATAPRSCMGKIHYCMSCPGWNKATDVRYVYSRWEWTKCCCGQVNCINGRQLDQFNADLVVDMSAHQNLCQICRGEGDILVHKLGGGDMSDNSNEFVLNDVPEVAARFQEMTFFLSKMNLKGLAAKGLGRLMGAVTWTFPAGYEGAAVKNIDKNRELVYYDSETAKRTVCGQICHLHICAKPQYKLTSERVLYTEWDFWYLCDDPAHLLCFPFYACFFGCRASGEDMCCCQGDGASRIAQHQARQAEKKLVADARGFCAANVCKIPIARTFRFFDMDLVADIGAHQNCTQLMTNEGDLQLYRLAGGDVDNKQKVFLVKDVPEVFSKFDDLSYVLSQMDLTHFRKSAIGQQMHAAGN
ncbi:unnamed protein product [Amoebophrya sp. A25]|nr:unnamed protein product [Amoebophrya sp. A25]|eukprot:GSA25T00000808001.1